MSRAVLLEANQRSTRIATRHPGKSDDRQTKTAAVEPISTCGAPMCADLSGNLIAASMDLQQFGSFALMKILTLVVTYNEAPNIRRLIPAIRHALPDSSILVVDDNSPDGTA